MPCHLAVQLGGEGDVEPCDVETGPGPAPAGPAFQSSLALQFGTLRLPHRDSATLPSLRGTTDQEESALLRLRLLTGLVILLPVCSGRLFSGVPGRQDSVSNSPSPGAGASQDAARSGPTLGEWATLWGGPTSNPVARRPARWPAPPLPCSCRGAVGCSCRLQYLGTAAAGLLVPLPVLVW